MPSARGNVSGAGKRRRSAAAPAARNARLSGLAAKRLAVGLVTALLVVAAVLLTLVASSGSGDVTVHDSFVARLIHISIGDASVCVQPLAGGAVTCDPPAAATGTLRTGTVVTAAVTSVYDSASGVTTYELVLLPH